MRRSIGCLWLVAGIMLALVAGIAGYLVTQGMAPSPPPLVAEGVLKTEVVIAAREIGVRQLITDQDLDVQEMPIELVPPGAVKAKADAIGKVAMSDIFPGEVLVEGRLTSPTITQKRNIAIVMDEDRLVFALPILDLMSRIDVLKSGDRVDVLVSFEVEKEEEAGTPAEKKTKTETELRTADTLQNVELSAIVVSIITTREGEEKEGGPEAILIALKPQDALVLKHLIDTGAIIDLALRAPTQEELFETEMVNMDYILDRFEIRPKTAR